MIKTRSIVFLLSALFLSVEGLADETWSMANNGNLLSPVVIPVEPLLASGMYEPRWQSHYPSAVTEYSGRSPRPISRFEFRDASALSRVSKLRALSVLTLADFGRAWLFLGVNREGLVGLHFGPLPKHSGERYLEMARMPYLRNAKPQ